MASRSRAVAVAIRPSLAPIVAAGLITGAAVGFVVAEWNRGAQEFGRYEAADPCTAPPDAYPGDGLDATVQRIALGGLNGAACELGTSREGLVLSLDPESGIGDVTWDRDTAAEALQSGTARAIDDAVERGTLPGWAGRVLRLRRRTSSDRLAPRTSCPSERRTRAGRVAPACHTARDA